MNKRKVDLSKKDYRAYSVLNIKSLNDDNSEYLEIKGVATTPKADRYGDIVEPKGAIFQNPMPLLWLHRSSTPVGKAWFETPTDEGIPFSAKIPYVKEEGELKKEVDKAIHTLKYGLINAVSIGFGIQEYSWIDETGGLRIIKWECHELSLVTVPANSDAIITEIKSLDRKSRRAIPALEDQEQKSVGASTSKKRVVQIKEI